MSAAKLPLAYRDQCAHLLIPLNKCRYDNYYLPWRCSVRSLSLSHPIPFLHKVPTSRGSIYRISCVKQIQRGKKENNKIKGKDWEGLKNVEIN